MSERQKQNEFLKELMRSQDSEDCRALQLRITEAERDERCICRAMRLAFFLAVASLAGLAYSSVFLTEFFQPATPRTVQVLTALLMASAICLVGLIGFWLWYRGVCDGLAQQARKLIIARQTSSSVTQVQIETTDQARQAQLLPVTILNSAS
jgi:ABC-type multidrug transport system fused ATPase/permease subunit